MQFSIFADHVVIATGGLGQIYSFTSSAQTVAGRRDCSCVPCRSRASGYGIYSVSSNPIYAAGGKGVGLVSEAVRGEGARLDNRGWGNYFMEGVHPL